MATSSRQGLLRSTFTQVSAQRTDANLGYRATFLANAGSNHLRSLLFAVIPVTQMIAPLGPEICLATSASAQSDKEIREKE